MVENLLKVIHILEGSVASRTPENGERIWAAINKDRLLTVWELEADLGNSFQKMLAFPKTKITFEREEISDLWWDSGNYDGAADGDSNKGFYRAFWTVELGELCEVPRCLLWRWQRHHCPMFPVSCIFFNKCHWGQLLSSSASRSFAAWWEASTLWGIFHTLDSVMPLRELMEFSTASWFSQQLLSSS